MREDDQRMVYEIAHPLYMESIYKYDVNKLDNQHKRVNERTKPSYRREEEEEEERERRTSMNMKAVSEKR